eukprot:3420602-Pyramimonas_sp.AAC.1
MPPQRFTRILKFVHRGSRTRSVPLFNWGSCSRYPSKKNATSNGARRICASGVKNTVSGSRQERACWSHSVSSTDSSARTRMRQAFQDVSAQRCVVF